MTLGEARRLIDDVALGADAVVEAVLPRFAQAFDGDDLVRFIVGIESEVGYGSEASRLVLFADPIGAPCTDALDVGQLLAHVAQAGLNDSTPLIVSIEGEPDDRVDGELPAQAVGVIRRFGNDLVPSLVLRLEPDRQ